VLKSRIIDEKASEIRGLQSDLDDEVKKRLSERDAQNAEIIKRIVMGILHNNL
jgi:hypothetical protein